MKTGAELIAEERKEQQEKHKIPVIRDVVENKDLQLREATVRLLEDPEDYRLISKPVRWDFERWQKMCKKSYKERLIIAGAFIAAEIDRLQYQEPPEKEMSAQQLAFMLTGGQYGDEITPKMEVLARENNLAVAYGVSDDILEIVGAIDEEYGAFEGGDYYFDKNGKESNPRDGHLLRAVWSPHQNGRTEHKP